ncbi:hypothetical protein OHB00_00155 [Streptomyces sp. NBC_00631]|uniref:hypothetical protein n=1 Tax=Streptomyces sp. NBC_00631 TaxID=2975793 RepID=UPI0030E1ED61
MTGQGISNYKADGEHGSVRGSLTVCYSFDGGNDGSWATQDDKLRAHTNEAPGRQGTKPNDQYSTVNWYDGSPLTVLTLASSTCTTNALNKRTITMQDDDLQNHWLDLR